MRAVACVIVSIFFAVLFCGTGQAIGNEDDGCMKISLSSLPIFGDYGNEDGGTSRNVEDEQEYTYNAMGQKVPVGTDRSGSALSGN